MMASTGSASATWPTRRVPYPCRSPVATLGSMRWYRNPCWWTIRCPRARTGMGRPGYWSTKRPSTNSWAARPKRLPYHSRNRPRVENSMIRHCVAGLALAGSSLVATAAALAGAVPASDLAPIQSGLDYHSFANIEQFRVTRLELDLRVDSTAKVLRGVVGLQIKRLDPGATELILDTRDISVAEVTQKAQDVLGATSKSETTWVGRPYHFEKKDPILGQALVIELPPSTRPTEFIRIEYETSPTAPALQWLTAKQTKHKPFLYTQSEPIGARSWIPLQDTPQVRMTYKAIVHTSPDVFAVMSAKNDPKVKRN